MREFSFVISLIAALVLLVAAVAWLRIYRNPKNDLQPVEAASRSPVV
jgi:hypothetical protein